MKHFLLIDCCFLRKECEMEEKRGIWNISSNDTPIPIPKTAVISLQQVKKCHGRIVTFFTKLTDVRASSHPFPQDKIPRHVQHTPGPQLSVLFLESTVANLGNIFVSFLEWKCWIWPYTILYGFAKWTSKWKDESFQFFLKVTNADEHSNL